MLVLCYISLNCGLNTGFKFSLSAKLRTLINMKQRLNTFQSRHINHLANICTGDCEDSPVLLAARRRSGVRGRAPGPSELLEVRQWSLDEGLLPAAHGA